MTYTEQIIRKAIEGGYNKNCDLLESGAVVTHCSNQVIFLDPSFWQALGKVLGWEMEKLHWKNGSPRGWLNQWHRFIDHLAKGKSPEEYFKELLTK